MEAPNSSVKHSTYSHLTPTQRYQLYGLVQSKVSQKEMSTALGVSESTISRELKRNSVSGVYHPEEAERIRRLRQKSKSPPVRLTAKIQRFIKILIRKDWSPEQIAGRLRLRGIPIVSHERVYQFIWEDKRNGGTLYTNLRQKLRRNSKRGSARKPRQKESRGVIPNQVSIDERPAIVQKNTEFGHYEIDTMIGKNHKGIVVTIVERMTKTTLMQAVECKRADLVTEAVVSMLSALNLPVRSITSDNGKEFARHQEIAERLNTSFYFAHPYSSWERGLNENTNGLIRQYFPKHTSLQNLPYESIKNALDKLNNRPRKSLNYKTPNELLTLQYNSIALSG
jgi:IS30 family transposase